MDTTKWDDSPIWEKIWVVPSLVPLMVALCIMVLWSTPVIIARMCRPQIFKTESGGN